LIAWSDEAQMGELFKVVCLCAPDLSPSPLRGRDMTKTPDLPTVQSPLLASRRRGQARLLHPQGRGLDRHL
jgi:hypothetical protein